MGGAGENLKRCLGVIVKLENINGKLCPVFEGKGKPVLGQHGKQNHFLPSTHPNRTFVRFGWGAGFAQW